MSEYLLVCGKDAADVVDVLAVAENLADGAQVDIAVPLEFADIAKLSTTVRRVVAIKTPDLPKMEKPAGRTWRDKLFSAAKTVATAAGENFRGYRDIAEEIRIASYDVVFDFNASRFSVAVARAAKTQKIVGFTSPPDAIAAAKLFYHDMRGVDNALCRYRRYAQLASLILDIPPAKAKWNLTKNLPSPGEIFAAAATAENASDDGESINGEPIKPPDSFFLLGGNIPKPFMQSLPTNKILIGDGAAIKFSRPLTAVEILSLASVAAAVIGNGLTTALAATTETKTLFIGSETNRPSTADLITTPGELQQSLAPAAAAEKSGAEKKEEKKPQTTDLRLKA